MADCPTYRGAELENGEIEFGSFERAVKEIHPPGFDGTLVQHHGKTVRRFSCRGILEGGVTTGAGSTTTAKMKAFEAMADTAIGTLIIPPLDRTFEKVRLISVRWTRFLGNATSGEIDVEYQMEFAQLADVGG
jgi:hypothetical protein